MARIDGMDNRDHTLVDTLGDDRLFGLGGNDILKVSGGVDTADGGTGTDTLVIDYGLFANDVITNAGPTANSAGGFDGQYYCYNGSRVDFALIERFDITTGSGNDIVQATTGWSVTAGAIRSTAALVPTG